MWGWGDVQPGTNPARGPEDDVLAGSADYQLNYSGWDGDGAWETGLLPKGVMVTFSSMEYRYYYEY